MSNLSEISHVRMFLNLQRDQKGCSCYMQKNNLLTFFLGSHFLMSSATSLTNWQALWGVLAARRSERSRELASTLQQTQRVFHSKQEDKQSERGDLDTDNSAQIKNRIDQQKQGSVRSSHLTLRAKSLVMINIMTAIKIFFRSLSSSVLHGNSDACHVQLRSTIW